MKVNRVSNVVTENSRKKTYLNKKRIKAIQKTNRVFAVYDKDGVDITDSAYSGPVKK